MDSKEIIERMDHGKRIERIDYMDLTKEIKSTMRTSMNFFPPSRVQNFTHI